MQKCKNLGIPPFSEILLSDKHLISASQTELASPYLWGYQIFMAHRDNGAEQCLLRRNTLKEFHDKNRADETAHNQCRRYLCPSDSRTILVPFFS